MIAYADDEMSLGEFLNEYPLHFYCADFSRLRGEEWFPCREAPDLFDRAQIQTIDWNGCNIQKEFYKQNEARDGRASVHEHLDVRLQGDANNTIIFYDHRSGEVADYLVVATEANRFVMTLYHCKKSGGQQPGCRIDDIYDAAGQVIKSFNLLSNEKELLKHFKHRERGGSRFVRGTLQEVQDLFRDRGATRLEYQLVIVQPGISKMQLDEAGASVLSAADEFIRSLGALPLVVLGSA